MERAAACTSGNIGERASPKHSEDVDSKQTHRKRSDSHDAISPGPTKRYICAAISNLKICCSKGK